MIARSEASRPPRPTLSCRSAPSSARLLHRAHRPRQGILATGGSEANENAIKIARLVTGRSKIITRRSSYHGATLAILGVAGDAQAPFEARSRARASTSTTLTVPVPGGGALGVGRQPRRADEREDPRTVAAVLLEGFTGTNGMQIPPRRLLAARPRRCATSTASC
jgi:4-aminobutyrate aminotransferase-like enzyme